MKNDNFTVPWRELVTSKEVEILMKVTQESLLYSGNNDYFSVPYDVRFDVLINIRSRLKLPDGKNKMGITYAEVTEQLK